MRWTPSRYGRAGGQQRTVAWLRLLAACLVLLATLQLTAPARATRLPADLRRTVLDEFPDGSVRMDGAIETKRGELFLPLVPAAAAARRKGKPVIEAVFPGPEHPDVIVYGNGWCFLRVIKKGVAKTVVLSGSLPDKLKKAIMACSFPSDLIVPDNFVLPESLKPLAQGIAVQTARDATIAQPDFGQPPKKARLRSGPGLIFLTSLTSGRVMLLEEAGFKKVVDFPTEGTPASMALVDGKLYISDQAKNRVLILDPERKQFLGQIDLPARSAPKGLAATPGGQLIYVAESGANDVAVIEAATGRVLLRTRVPPGPGRIAVTPNGNFLIVLSVTSGQVTIISTLNQRVLATIPVGVMPTCVAITRDSQRAYVTNRQANTISVIDIGDKQVVATIATGEGPTGVALSRDDSKLYVANARENSISVYDTTSHRKLQDVKLPLDVDFPGPLYLMPDGQHLVISSGATDTIAMLNLASMQFDQQCTIGHTSQEIIWVPR